jgi:hypothetical protein
MNCNNIFIRLLFLTIFLLFFSCSNKNINRFKNKERQGKWVIYYDSTQTLVDSEGKYRNGNPKGTWRYYSKNGNLIKTEKYCFRKIKTNYYFENGNLYKSGKAKIVSDKVELHYFYYGKWKIYNERGELIKLQLYRDGKFVSEKSFKSNTHHINDSLADVVKKTYKMCSKYSDSLAIAQTKFGKQSNKYKRIAELNRNNGLAILLKIDEIIGLYGYPGRTLVGDEYATVFSIISISNLSTKLKYYNTILSAADKGELDWSDVAFFVDKVKVAQHQKQVYGTQYKITENNYKNVYYPIEDKINLNNRRKRAGLDPFLEGLSEINDTAIYQQ